MNRMVSIATTMVISTLLFSTHQVMAGDKGKWTVRAGVTTVEPRESSDQLALNGSRTDFINAVGTEKLGLDRDSQLGLTIEYRLSDHWGIELLAASPFEHTATGTGALAGVNIANAKQLPPTLSTVYHFNVENSFQPYVALGLNYTLFFSEGTTTEADNIFATLGLTGASVDLDNSWGLSAQAGLDYQINEHWSLNVSARWIDIDTKATIRFDNGSKISADIEIDPIVYSLMAGYSF